MTHVDVVKNEWLAYRQVRLERLPPDTKPIHGDYLFTTDPHSDDDCPFKDDDVLLMRLYDER